MFSCEFCESFKNTFCRKLKTGTSVISQNAKFKTFKLSIATMCTGCEFENNLLEAWNFHKWILVGGFSSTADSSVWRWSEIGCSKNFRTPWKHPWWSLFSLVESFKFENYVKVDSFTDIFMEIYQNSYKE